MEQEHAQYAVDAPTCPRYLTSPGYDVASLAALARRLQQEKVPTLPPSAQTADFRVVFALENDETAKITCALQEDQVLRTQLKLKRGKEVVDLPSFWDVWFDGTKGQQPWPLQAHR
jgi:hypothetical protein